MKILTLLILILTPLIFAEDRDAAAIIDDHTKQLIADLTAYTDLNPEAPDLDQAFAAMARAYADLGNKRKVLSLMEERYHLNKLQEEVGLDQLFSQFVSPIAMTYAEEGMKRDGRRFLLEVRRDFRSHELYPQIGQILNKLDEKFHGLLPGDPIDFNFKSLKRGEARASQYKGRWVLIVFWSMRNVGTRLDLPSLKSTYGDYKERGLQIIAINEDDRKTDLEKFIDEQGLSWINVHDKNATNKIAETLMVTTTPANILLDPNGQVVKLNIWGDSLRAYLALHIDRKN
ncbi:MAG: peroxiredoxin [Kiritimatiellia bacterium]|jgi:peroxiredoxin